MKTLAEKRMLCMRVCTHTYIHASGNEVQSPHPCRQGVLFTLSVRCSPQTDTPHHHFVFNDFRTLSVAPWLGSPHCQIKVTPPPSHQPILGGGCSACVCVCGGVGGWDQKTSHQITSPTVTTSKKTKNKTKQKSRKNKNKTKQQQQIHRSMHKNTRLVRQKTNSLIPIHIP